MNTPKAPLTRRNFIQNSGLGLILSTGIAPYIRAQSKTKTPTAPTPPPPTEGPSLPPTPFNYTPFVQALPIPPRLAPVTLSPAPGTNAVGAAGVYHGIAPEYYSNHPTRQPDWVAVNPETGQPFAEKRHAIAMRKAYHRFIPSVSTPVFGYNSIVPGPTMRARFGEPMVVRVTNELGGDVETSVHLHGGHSPAHSDGHPCFYVFPNQARDYYYPNIVPRGKDGKLDAETESPSTMWYHDHGNDVTAHNVNHGLMGFCLFTDRLEENLIKNRVLPDIDLRNASGQLILDANGATIQGKYDIPLGLSDQRLNSDGTIYWDPLDHDGNLGDLMTVNGVTQPFLNVEPRKYRFRLAGCGLARHFVVRLSNGQPMIQIGNDSWLLPKAVNVSEVYLNPSKRADVIIDFTKLAGKEVFLENIMQQTSGRKGDGIDATRPTRLLRFIVGRSRDSTVPEFSLVAGTALRPHTNILESEATVTRYFDFNRSNGAWQINGEFYSAYRCDAAIRLGATEKWVLRNGSGGWWHPIHMHLEAHQILRINGAAPRETWKYKSDNVPLEDYTTAEVLMRFRTFEGPFMFHCHNNNHEDMRMMKQFEVCGIASNGATKPPLLNGTNFSIPAAISGIPEAYVASHPALFS